MNVTGGDPFLWSCPECRDSLASVSRDERRCEAEGHRYRRIRGIWRFLSPGRRARFEVFVREYETVRRGEGRGCADPEYYRQLPFRDLTGRFADSWRIRTISYRAFLKRVVAGLEEKRPVLKVLDLGAGNCWLANRLAERGHQVAAVDLTTSAEDGLGASRHYATRFTPVQADFDRLPFAPGQFDLAVYNSAFHYSEDYGVSLKEACRALTSRGRIVILDTPVYGDPDSGEQMVREREADFCRRFGFASNQLRSENFLTPQRLDELSEACGLHFTQHRPCYGWRWALKPWKARLRGHREPARFALIVGSRRGTGEQ